MRRFRALYPTSLLQTLTERCDPMLSLRIILGVLQQNGELALPTRPGLGLEFDQPTIDRYRA